jgi:hypothetical protein
MAGKEGRGVGHELGTGRAFLVGEGADKGHPRVVVDGYMQVIEAHTARVYVSGSIDPPAEHLPTPALSDFAQLLHVDVEELAWPLSLVANDRASGTVDDTEPGNTLPAQHPVDGGAVPCECIGQAMWPMEGLEASRDDRCDLL